MWISTYQFQKRVINYNSNISTHTVGMASFHNSVTINIKHVCAKMNAEQYRAASIKLLCRSSCAVIGHYSEQGWQCADYNINTGLDSVMLRPTISDSLCNVINTVCLQFPCIWKLRQTFCWNVNNWHHDWWSSGLQIYLKSRKQRSCLTLDKPLVVTKGATLGGHKCCHQSSKIRIKDIVAT